MKTLQTLILNDKFYFGFMIPLVAFTIYFVFYELVFIYWTYIN